MWRPPDRAVSSDVQASMKSRRHPWTAAGDKSPQGHGLASQITSHPAAGHTLNGASDATTRWSPPLALGLAPETTGLPHYKSPAGTQETTQMPDQTAVPTQPTASDDVRNGAQQDLDVGPQRPVGHMQIVNRAAGKHRDDAAHGGPHREHRIPLQDLHEERRRDEHRGRLGVQDVIGPAPSVPVPSRLYLPPVVSPVKRSVAGSRRTSGL